MKTVQNKRAIIVGIFISVALAILIVTVFTLGGQRKTFVRKIPVKVVFDDVGGLKEGDNVWFAGVKIGTVKKVDLTGGSHVDVTLNIEKSAQPYIRKDARVKLSSNGLLGNKIVVITAGSAAALEVRENDYLVQEKVESTEDMLSTLQANNKNLLEITENLKIVTAKISRGEGTIGSLLNDSSLIVGLRRTVSNFKTVSVNSGRVIANLENFTAQLNKEGTSINELLNDTIVFNNLRLTVTELREAAYTANKFTDNIRAASSHLNDSDNVLSILLNDPQAAAQLKITLANLQSGSKKLDENLEALQHNFLFRGFFKKKKREEQQ